MNIEEGETEQNDGLSTQNRELPSDGDDSQLDSSFQNEGQPSVSHSVSSIQNKTQQEKGIITKRLASKLMVVTNESLFILCSVEHWHYSRYSAAFFLIFS